MPITISLEDLEFLRTVQDLGMQGLTQSEISARLECSAATLRYRLNRLGFEPVSLTDLRTCLGGRRLEEMLAAGELVAVESVEPAPAEAVA